MLRDTALNQYSLKLPDRSNYFISPWWLNGTVYSLPLIDSVVLTEAFHHERHLSSHLSSAFIISHNTVQKRQHRCFKTTIIKLDFITMSNKL